MMYFGVVWRQLTTALLDARVVVVDGGGRGVAEVDIFWDNDSARIEMYVYIYIYVKK